MLSRYKQYRTFLAKTVVFAFLFHIIFSFCHFTPSSLQMRKPVRNSFGIRARERIGNAYEMLLGLGGITMSLKGLACAGTSQPLFLVPAALYLLHKSLCVAAAGIKGIQTIPRRSSPHRITGLMESKRVSLQKGKRSSSERCTKQDFFGRRYYQYLDRSRSKNNNPTAYLSLLERIARPVCGGPVSNKPCSRACIEVSVKQQTHGEDNEGLYAYYGPFLPSEHDQSSIAQDSIEAADDLVVFKPDPYPVEESVGVDNDVIGAYYAALYGLSMYDDR